MRNNAQPAGAVKQVSPRENEEKRWELQRFPLSQMCLRLDGYLKGCFNRGARFKIWDKRQFHRATLDGKPRAITHIEQAFTLFRKTSTAWHFEDIWISSKDADGIRRRHRRIKIVPAGRGLGPTQLETTTRFLAYVTNAAKLNGSVKVDRAFLVSFWRTTGLPEEWIRIAWQRTKKIRGYRVKWRGKGNGRKAVVSLPHFSTRSSSPTGRRLKTGGPTAPDFLPSHDSGPIGPTGENPDQGAAAIAATRGEDPPPLPPPSRGGTLPLRARRRCRPTGPRQAAGRPFAPPTAGRCRL